ncbi:hypothetical protein C2857_001841 [Epichloe festucae Fl1]|uniref:DUF803 domain membrane protein n=1 Tax=Epichloe festucae (strain Fl1) TaxID=877507 RepID=A0A7S9PTK4_EPIFF|nr:hypothetical protein C2857_001841 [Epichloe festucae Fl1]
MDVIATGPSRSIAIHLNAVTSAAATPTKTQIPTDPGEVLEEWSSLIGIITAIVGNVLIALALNVQRYAHTRIHKERARIRQRARALTKRSQSNGDGNGDSYGTMSTVTIGHDGSSGDQARGSRSSEILGDPTQDELRGHETDPLSVSFLSTPSKDDCDMNEDQKKATSNYLKSPYWWLGQMLITLGEMGNFLAYGFAPASIVSPLGVVALISNCIIAPVMFHERFRARDFWGVVIAVAGVVTVVFSANQEETKLEPHDVLDAITTTEFEIYLGVTIFLIIVLMWASSKYGRSTILIDLALVGLFGGYTALATKGVSSMLSSTLWRAFTTPVAYALVFILLVTAVMQIRYVNKALQRFDSTQVIPIQFVLFTLCVILGSAVLYRDFEKTTPKQVACFVGGCLLTFFGVFVITSGRRPEEDDDDEDLLSEIDGVEENIGLSRHEEGLGAQESQGPATPKSKSRRSSRMSRASFADSVNPEPPRDKAGIPTLGQKASDSAPHLIGIKPPVTMVGNPWRESWSSTSSLPRGDRTLSTYSAATESAVVSTSGNSNATTPVRDPDAVLTYPADPPVTPRPGTGLYRANSHHRSKTFISPSPLSSTVTTVVKDAFLRDDNNYSAHRSSLRRIQSSIRASLFFNDDNENNTEASGYTPIPTSDVQFPRPRENSEIDVIP